MLDIEDLKRQARILAADIEQLAADDFDLILDQQQNQDELDLIRRSLARMAQEVGVL